MFVRARPSVPLGFHSARGYKLELARELTIAHIHSPRSSSSLTAAAHASDKKAVRSLAAGSASMFFVERTPIQFSLRACIAAMMAAAILMYGNLACGQLGGVVVNGLGLVAGMVGYSLSGDFHTKPCNAPVLLDSRQR